MKVKDVRLDELADGSQNVAYFEVVSIAKELQSLRKIDIAYTLKYAEEAGAACEEMKYGIEQAVEEMRKLACGSTDDEYERMQQDGVDHAIRILKIYTSKHIDFKE